MRHPHLTGRLWIVCAAVLWSSSGLFVKAPLFADWSEPVRGPLLAFWRAAFAFAVLLPIIRRPRWQRDLVPLACSFTSMNVLYLTAMTLTTAANAIWLQNTAPWWVLLLGLCFFRQPPARRDLLPLGFAAVGLGTILWFEIPGQARAGVACGVASGVSYACVILFMRRLRDENPAWLVAVNHLIAAAALLPWVIYLGVWPSPAQLAVLVLFGPLQMAIPYMMLIRGLRTVSSQEAVVIGLLEPVLLPIWVLIVWREVPAWWTLLGASFILTGLLLRYVVLENLAAKQPTVDTRG